MTECIYPMKGKEHVSSCFYCRRTKKKSHITMLIYVKYYRIIWQYSLITPEGMIKYCLKATRPEGNIFHDLKVLSGNIAENNSCNIWFIIFKESTRITTEEI